jgi:hypothetical protein
MQRAKLSEGVNSSVDDHTVCASGTLAAPKSIVEPQHQRCSKKAKVSNSFNCFGDQNAPDNGVPKNGSIRRQR